MTNDCHANQWPDLVAITKYPNNWARRSSKPAYDNHKDALRALVASVTRTMTRLVDTGETVL